MLCFSVTVAQRKKSVFFPCTLRASTPRSSTKLTCNMTLFPAIWHLFQNLFQSFSCNMALSTPWLKKIASNCSFTNQVQIQVSFSLPPHRVQINQIDNILSAFLGTMRHLPFEWLINVFELTFFTFIELYLNKNDELTYELCVVNVT